MSEHPVLGQVALGYSPMIDRQRSVVATRLTIFPERPDAAPDPDALLQALLSVWPDDAANEPMKLVLRPLDPRPVATQAAALPPTHKNSPVSLNIAGEALLHAVMDATPPPHLMLEIPAFMAGDPLHADAIKRLREAGSVLLIKGRPLKPLAPDVLVCFSHSIVDVGDERRTEVAPAPGVRSVSTVQAGTRSTVDIERAFQRGAVAVLGWPYDDPLPAAGARSAVASDVSVVLDLINGVEREEPVAKLEALLRRDPTVAFRLMRYLNSPAFGLSVEVNSFGHALMLLGRTRLKRWLALLLASSSKAGMAQPLIHAAVRRGLLLEELGRGQGDPEMRGEMFICGVFSLLDRLLQQPFASLMQNLPVPERVQQALCDQGGPYAPYLELLRAIEQESVVDIREQCDQLMLGLAEVNRALLVALSSARQLDG